MRNCAVGTFDGHRVTVYAGKVQPASSDAVPSSAGSSTTWSRQTEGGLEVVSPGQPARSYPAGTSAPVEIVGVRGGTLLLQVARQVLRQGLRQGLRRGGRTTTRTFDLATGTFTPPA